MPYPRAVSSARSTGWRRSILYRGKVTVVPLGSSRLLRRQLLISDSARSRPVTLRMSGRSRGMLEGDRSGVASLDEKYFISTVWSDAPASASVVAMIARTSAPSFLSVEVTSMKRFLVDAETFVSLPLMIGGKERTVFFESLRIGYNRESGRTLEYLRPVSVRSSTSTAIPLEEAS